MDDGKILEVNDAFSTISGYSREEALDSSTFHLKLWVHEEDRQLMVAALKNGQAFINQEIMLRSKNGNILTVLFSAQSIQLSHRTCIISSVEDFTKRKQAEEALRNLNRLYSLLSGINQIIIRCHNQQELFQSVCEAVVERGGFRMAWIGKINTVTNRVDVAASQGFSEDYLKNINIDLNNEETSGGPTGRAVKSGVHVICNNILNDESMNHGMMPRKKTVTGHQPIFRFW